MLSVQKAEINVSLSDRIRLFIHLLICQYCRLFNKQSKMIDKILSNWKTNKTLSTLEKKQLQTEIEKKLK